MVQVHSSSPFDFAEMQSLFLFQQVLKLRIQQLAQNTLTLIQKHFGHSIGLRVFICTGMHQAFIKGKNLRTGNSKQNGRMRANQELGTCLYAAYQFFRSSSIGYKVKALCLVAESFLVHLIACISIRQRQILLLLQFLMPKGLLPLAYERR